MNIVVDMNLSPAWCDYLAEHGHHAQHWSTIGPSAASDESIMRWAREHDALVLTHDLDFGAILAATGADSPSVIQLRILDVMPQTVGEVVVRVLNEFCEPWVAGALVAVDVQKMRVRLLPLNRGV